VSKKPPYLRGKKKLCGYVKTYEPHVVKSQPPRQKNFRVIPCFSALVAKKNLRHPKHLFFKDFTQV